MAIITEVQKKLIKRNAELKRLGKVRLAIDRIGVSPNTYYRAINGDERVQADTLDRILTGQQEMIEFTYTSLKNK